MGEELAKDPIMTVALWMLGSSDSLHCLTLSREVSCVEPEDSKDVGSRAHRLEDTTGNQPWRRDQEVSIRSFFLKLMNIVRELQMFVEIQD